MAKPTKKVHLLSEPFKDPDKEKAKELAQAWADDALSKFDVTQFPNHTFTAEARESPPDTDEYLKPINYSFRGVVYREPKQQVEGAVTQAVLDRRDKISESSRVL